MLASLLKKLAAQAETLDADDARTAVAALLVILAHADHAYDARERAQIEAVLAARYGLNAAEAAALRAEGEAAEAASVDFYKFTALVKKAIPLEERGALVEALWRVALADAARERHEDAFIGRVADVLGLSPVENAHARRRASGG